MSDDAVRVQQIEAELRELRQTLGIQYAELHRCMAQRDDATRTLARVQRELRQALDGREAEYHRAEAALEVLREALVQRKGEP
jgi:uncharacterized protein involved in exopolysaccharide biosynthesis